jgi:hypothetical protein
MLCYANAKIPSHRPFNPFQKLSPRCHVTGNGPYRRASLNFFPPLSILGETRRTPPLGASPNVSSKKQRNKSIYLIARYICPAHVPLASNAQFTYPLLSFAVLPARVVVSTIYLVARTPCSCSQPPSNPPLCSSSRKLRLVAIYTLCFIRRVLKSSGDS